MEVVVCEMDAEFLTGSFVIMFIVIKLIFIYNKSHNKRNLSSYEEREYG